MQFAKFGALLLLSTLPIAAPVASWAQSAAPSAAPSATEAAPSAEKAEAREKYRAACGADVQKFCANIERAKGAMRSCLETNEAALSPSCKAARAERAAARGKDKS